MSLEAEGRSEGRWEDFAQSLVGLEEKSPREQRGVLSALEREEDRPLPFGLEEGLLV